SGGASCASVIEAERAVRLPGSRFRNLADRRRRRRWRLRLSRVDVADRVRASRPARRLTMAHPKSINRRAFLTGEQPDRHYISSAVIIALPARLDGVRGAIETMPGVEIHACEGSRIVVTIEGPTSGSLG